MDTHDLITNDSTFEHNMKHYFFTESLNCHHCGVPLFIKEEDSYTWVGIDEKGLPCPHVVFMLVETGYTEFIKVRPDFAIPYIKSLIKSEKYQEHLKKPHTLPLKKNEIAYFATGTFTNHGIGHNDFSYIDNIRMRVGRFMRDLPPFTHTESLPDETIIFESSFLIGKMYVGGFSNSGSVYIALTSTEYCETSFKDLSVDQNSQDSA